MSITVSDLTYLPETEAFLLDLFESDFIVSRGLVLTYIEEITGLLPSLKDHPFFYSIYQTEIDQSDDIPLFDVTDAGYYTMGIILVLLLSHLTIDKSNMSLQEVLFLCPEFIRDYFQVRLGIKARASGSLSLQYFIFVSVIVVLIISLYLIFLRQR